MRLPKNSTGALLIGLMSGSPAGACALASAPADESDPPGACLRAALMASGASPAFLLTGIAVSMLNLPEAGPVLLRSQLASVLLTGLLLRSFGTGRPSGTSSRQKQHGPVPAAMLTLLTIGGYMAFFSVLARLIALSAHPVLETPVLAVLELAGGCRALCSLQYDISLLLPLVSAASCFGGISVYLQCMSFLAPLNVHPAEYAAGKLVQAALTALITFLQIEPPCAETDPLLLAVLFLTALLSLLLIAVRLEKRHFSHTKKQPIQPRRA